MVEHPHQMDYKYGRCHQFMVNVKPVAAKVLELILA